MEERRKHNMCDYENCIFKEKIGNASESVIEIKGDIKNLSLRINGSLEKISSFMDSGIWWRRTIVALSFSLVLSIGSAVYTFATLAQNYGRNERQIEVNSHRLDIIEQLQRGEK